jgi:GDP-mannose 6-dehydrogenase
MSQSISIFGLGYVGTVTAACLAHTDNQVIGVDLNRGKVEALQSGSSPIVEPRVSELISDGHKSGRLLLIENAWGRINVLCHALCVEAFPISLAANRKEHKRAP